MHKASASLSWARRSNGAHCSSGSARIEEYGQLAAVHPLTKRPKSVGNRGNCCHSLISAPQWAPPPASPPSAQVREPWSSAQGLVSVSRRPATLRRDLRELHQQPEHGEPDGDTQQTASTSVSAGEREHLPTAVARPVSSPFLHHTGTVPLLCLQNLIRGEGGTQRRVAHVLDLAFLAPNIVRSIVEGRQPQTLTADSRARLGTLVGREIWVLLSKG